MLKRRRDFEDCILFLYCISWMVLLICVMLGFLFSFSWTLNLREFLEHRPALCFVILILIVLPLWMLREDQIYREELEAQEKAWQKRLRSRILLRRIYRGVILAVFIVIAIRL